ncbi:MAG: phage tail spike protein [Leuconostoc mesenteroides]
MTPILYEKDEIDFTSQGLGSLVEIYDVDVEEQRNGLLQLTASYPVSGVRYADISVGRIILAKPNQRDDVHAFRIVSTELDISGYAVKIEADSITYDLTHNVVKHLVASGNGQAFMTALKNAVVNPSIFAFYSDIATSSTTLLNFVNPMEAIMGTTGSFLQIWGGELKRENRRVAMFNRRGRDNVATFRLGKNISGLKYSVDISSLVTRIIPTKSVQNDDQTTTILEGAPIDSQYINNYEQIYTLPLEFTDDSIKTVADLNAAAKGWFTQSANTGRDKPTVTIDIDVLSLQDSADYQDKFKNLESVSLTDTVTVYVPEYGVNVTAIVNELHYDPILDRVTKMTVGTAKQSFADSSRTQLSDLQDKIISVQNQADAVAVSANGKSTNYYGSVEPSHPQEGDTWFWVNGDKSGIKVFVNGNWVEPVDSDTQEKIEASVTKAVTQAKSHTDEVKQGLSSDIATAKSQAASLANAAEANAKSEATSLFSRAQNALSDAKTDLTKSISSEASKAVAAANSLAQKYVDEAKKDINDTINAFSVGGRNLLLNSKGLVDGYGTNGNVRLTVEPFDSTTNMWHITLPKGGSWNAGIYFFQPGNVSNLITKGQQWALSFDIKGTGVHSEVGVEASSPFNSPSGNVTADWTRVSSTGTATGTNAIIIYFNSKDVALDVYIKLPKLETGTIPTDWTPAPEDVVLDYTTKDNKIKETITQYQDTNDRYVRKAQTDATTALGLVETKVSQTDYDKKTGELSSHINDVKDTADKSLKTIADIQKADGKQDERMAEIEQTAEGIKSTVSDLSTAQEKQSGYISTLQQSAKGFEATVTKVDNLAVGGRNLLLGTRDWTDNTRWNQRGTVTKDVYRGMVIASTGGAWSSPVYMMQNAGILQVGKTYTFSTYVRNTSDTDTNVAPYYEDGIVTPVYTPTSLPAHTDWFRVSITFQCVKDPTTSTSTLRWEGQNALTNGQIQFAGYKLEEGNIATDWTPAPEDVDSTVAKVKLTADEASTAVSKLTGVDGVITKAQAAIKVNADAINEKVSKTVYDQKTGELLKNINEAKDTADKSLQTIGDYKTSNDKRVEAAESSIERTANAITEKVSKTDYDKKTGELTHDLSELKHTAEGFEATVTKVDNLSVGSRNLYLNSRGLADGYGINGNAKVTVEPFDSTTNMWHIVAAQGNGNNIGIYLWNYCKGKIPDDSDWSYSADVKGTGKAVTFGIERDSNKPVKGNIRSEWSRISQTGHVDYGVKTLVMYFDTTDSLLDVYIKLPKLETGNIPTDWTPAPEDTATALAQVKHTADSISNFVRDSSGNISSDFQTALSKTSIITGSALATSIQNQTSSQISSALIDNNGKIISLINQDSSGVQIAGKNIVLDGNTTVNGDFYAKGGNFTNLNASNITVGTLNGNQVNITNLNASNIVSGAISGANLNIDLNTGQVQFQKGRIFKSDYTTDINIDQGYISTADSNTRVLLKSGQMQFVAPNVFDLQNTPYLKVYNGTGGNSFAGANLSGRDYIALYNSANVSNVFDAPVGTESFSGISTGRASTGKWAPTKVGGADRGVIISGGRTDGWLIVERSPYIFVGSDANGTSAYGNRVYVHADYFHVPTVYSHGGSTGANVYVAADGAILKSSSATKYKTNIEHETDSIQGDQLLTIDPATWNDKFESEQLERYHETGVEPERKINMEGKRYYGIIAEDLVKAGLEELVTRNEETDEVEGVEYSKIGVALIPIVRDLRNKLNEQAVEIERLKDKNK